MRAGIGFVMFVVGCAPSADHQLPSATFTPHLASATTAVACGDDIALYGNTAPDLRYRFTYDNAGRLAHADGAYTAGGNDDSIDYTWAGDNLTHLLETRGFGDSRVEITADYDASNSLIDYTWDLTEPSYHDSWSYVFSSFVGVDQPTREVITEQGQPDFGYQLAYDASHRLVTATPDSGPSTTWTYDDAARTIAIDTGSGAFHGVVAFDAQDRELSETWGGSDPSMVDSDLAYAWNGDQLDSSTYRSGTTAAPHQLATVEVDTIRYDCAMARASSGRGIRLVSPRAR